MTKTAPSSSSEAALPAAALSSACLLLKGVGRNVGRSLLATPPLQAIGGRIHSSRSLRQRREQSCETRFFRNVQQLSLLAELSRGFLRSGGIRVAVLGCSTGAEVISFLAVMQPAAAERRVALVAVDVSVEAIERAKRGVYLHSGPELLGVNRELTRNVLVGSGNTLKVRDELLQAVSWRVGDAFDPELCANIGQQDLVLANNFLIHMNPNAARRCLTNILPLVSPGGYIALSGIDLDVRSAVMKESGFIPVTTKVIDVHRGDKLLLRGWPWSYWGLAPIDTSYAGWEFRYATVFRRPDRGSRG